MSVQNSIPLESQIENSIKTMLTFSMIYLLLKSWIFMTHACTFENCGLY